MKRRTVTRIRRMIRAHGDIALIAALFTLAMTLGLAVLGFARRRWPACHDSIPWPAMRTRLANRLIGAAAAIGAQSQVDYDKGIQLLKFHSHIDGGRLAPELPAGQVYRLELIVYA